MLGEYHRKHESLIKFFKPARVVKIRRGNVALKTFFEVIIASSFIK